MRHLLTKTIYNFKQRFPKGFHDSHLLSINYDFNAGHPPHSHAHRVSVKISVPDWKAYDYSRFPNRLTLLIEMEGMIDYLLLKKQENIHLAVIHEIDVMIQDGYVVIDFLPYHDTHPLRGRADIYKHYEKERLHSLFILKGKICYWSVVE